MTKVFLFDFNRCNGCHNCQIACKDEHCEQDWSPYAAAQPLTGQFWCKVNEYERGQVPWTRVAYEPVLCGHCAEAPCMDAAALAGRPEAVYRRQDGLVIIDPQAAHGLVGLAESCPVSAIYYNSERDLPQKCTGCAHLLDAGWTEPRCTDACPTEALRFVDEDDARLGDAEVLEALEDHAPKLYYLNRPKRFIAGTLVDIAADEVVIGAKVELLDQSGNVVLVTESDELGDFRFDQVDKAVHTVRALGKDFVADVSACDLSLGDIDIAA
ncbi:MAG: hypothetical protein LBP28_04145 [Coriobacteriales bacterium]|jgi:Fe-S-cluster-containing dehydrogenase component|nr:hypothetical protein [Coriobacteriales bacterium]